MSDILWTLAHYEAVCHELGVPSHPYIGKMLERENRLSRLKKDFRSSMHLYLAGNNKLLCKNRITDNDCQLLARFLAQNSFVVSVDLRYNEITDKGAQIIANMLAGNKTLYKLNLMCNDIGPTGAEALAKALHTNGTLRSLRLNGNKLEEKQQQAGMYFAQALQVNTTLEHLDLGDTDLRTESVIALASVLVYNKKLRSVNLNRPILFTVTEEPTVHLAKMLKVNSSLEEIHLQKYDTRDFGAIRLAENLMHNFTLKHLDLSCNRITRDGVKELAKVLRNNTALEVLDLGYNRLENDGAMHIADAIATANTNLKCLVVVYNNIKSAGLCALVDAMKINKTLDSIFIWGNVLEEPACIAFASLIEKDRLNMHNTDVQPYVVDGKTYLCQLNNGIGRHYYYAGVYGDDVPDWQPCGDARNRQNCETQTPDMTLVDRLFDKIVD